MLDLLAGKSPRSARVERLARHMTGAAVARVLLALICTVIFLFAVAAPYFAALLVG